MEILPPQYTNDENAERTDPTRIKLTTRMVIIHEVPYTGTEPREYVIEVPIPDRNLPA